MSRIHCELYWAIFDRWQPALDQARDAGGLAYLEAIAKMDAEMTDHERTCGVCSDGQKPEET